MNKLINPFFATSSMMRPGAFVVGLRTHAPVSQSQAMKGMEVLAGHLPELTQSRFDEKDTTFVLRNTETEIDKQTFLRVEKYQVINYAWGPQVEFDIEHGMVDLFDAIQDGFQLGSVNIELIDLQFYAICTWAGNHYRALSEAFFGNSPLAGLFGDNLILQDDLYLRGIVEESRPYAVHIESNVKDVEVISGKFENDRLRAMAGVAFTGQFPLAGRIAPVFLKHAKVAIDFVNTRFVPHVIEPLERILLTHSSGVRSNHVG